MGKYFVFGLILALVAGTASADPDHPTRAEAVAFVKSAIAAMKKDGIQKTFAEIDDPSNPKFHKGSLYIFVFNGDGVQVAHGVNPRLINVNLLHYKDSDGKEFANEGITHAKESGSAWVNYKFFNPKTKKIEPKQAYMERFGNYFVGTGIYGSR